MTAFPESAYCHAGWTPEAFLPARLDLVRRCPARAEYIELCFTTQEGQWNWCFPEPPRREKRTDGALALKLGTYGVQAHPVNDDDLGPALPSETALPMILAGAEVVIDRRLVAANK